MLYLCSLSYYYPQWRERKMIKNTYNISFFAIILSIFMFSVSFAFSVEKVYREQMERLTQQHEEKNATN